MDSSFKLSEDNKIKCLTFDNFFLVLNAHESFIEYFFMCDEIWVDYNKKIMLLNLMGYLNQRAMWSKISMKLSIERKLTKFTKTLDEMF